MELALRDVKARLSELIPAAERGERVEIAKHGQPAAELIRFRQRGWVDFDRLARACVRHGLTEESRGWPASLDDPAAGRRVLGLVDSESGGPYLT